MSKKVAVLCVDPQCRADSERLANEWGVSCLESPDDAQFDFYYVITAERCELRAAKYYAMAPFYIDFLHGPIAYRCRRGGGRRQPLARAMGLKPGYNPRVLDLTAGLGRDAWVLASLGCEVVMIERSPVVAALLNDGLQRALCIQPLSIALEVMDAADYIQALSIPPEVVYLDPMFPDKSKTALVKKEMQILQYIVSEPDDSQRLFALACRSGCQRVVVKRPQWAPSLGAIKPDAAVATKRHRFDIYVL